MKINCHKLYNPLWLHFIQQIVDNTFCKIYELTYLLIICKYISGAPAGGKEEASPTRNQKNIAEKWRYFPELYKRTKVREYRIENG